MKKFRIIIALTLVLAMLFGFTASATVISSANSVVNNDKYEYPITPQKTPEIWRSFSTHQEMLEACEIPKDTLEAMSTKSLLLACLEYPLAGDALCYDNVYAGFESVMNNSNALTELFSRSDFSDALASLFETTTAVNLKNNTTGFECITQFISLITAHSVKNELISQNDEKRIIDNIDAFVKGLSNDNLSASIRSIMAADNYNSKASYITLNGHNYYYSTTSVKTPKMSTVTALKFTNELCSSDVSILNNYLSTYYPNATKISNPSIKYNCHSYAWHSGSTSNTYWINDPAKYMSDGSYSYLGTISSSSSNVPGAVHGNKAFYKNTDNNNHSAIIYNSTLYTSKWGAGCLVRHAQTYCPYWNSTTKIKIYERVY